MFSAVLFALAMVALIYSYHRDRQKTRDALRITMRQFKNMMPSMLGIIGLIGLVLALLPAGFIEGLFGNRSAIGILLISAIGAVTLIPAFISFPLASSLLDAGAGITAVACFITSLMMVGTITAPLEMEYFGTRFTLLRNGFGLITAVVVGLLMGAVLQ